MTELGWTPSRATALLLERELFGMSFQLGRIKLLLEELGNPQESFRAIHIVGTNGKTSTCRFAAAALAANGLTVGAYISPHLTGFHERVLLSSDRVVDEVTPEEFAIAVGLVATAAERVEPNLEDAEVITQFELVTTAAFVLFQQAGVEVAVIEAGLGGRWDATNVLPSPKTVVFASVGLDHTRWLGEDTLSIAREKLAVVGPGDSLVVPTSLESEIASEAVAVAAKAGAQLMVVGSEQFADLELSAAGAFQVENFALAMTAAASVAPELTDADIAAAAQVEVAGRMMVVDQEPLTFVDAAHNPHGAKRLAEAISAAANGKPITGVLGMLEDKDALAFVRELAPVLAAVVVTQPLNPRALDSSSLVSVCQEAGFSSDAIRFESGVKAALAAARAEAGEDGVVLVTGSIHLVGDLLSPPGERIVSAL